jgi:hypothetical protein
MKVNFIFLLILMAGLNACENNLSDPTYLGKGFQGITFTDEASPQRIKGDKTDWCGQTSGNYPHEYSFGPAYPNPVTGNSFNIQFALPQSSNVRMYLINSNDKVVKTIINKRLNAGVYRISVNTEGLPKSVYRTIIETDIFTCYGDVWVK